MGDQDGIEFSTSFLAQGPLFIQIYDHIYEPEAHRGLDSVNRLLIL